VETSGGRVLAVVAVADDLPAARTLAYEGVGRIDFAGAQYRSDVAARAAADLSQDRHALR
jgi:phosphoribosylamine--glycine ligase